MTTKFESVWFSQKLKKPKYGPSIGVPNSKKQVEVKSDSQKFRDTVDKQLKAMRLANGNEKQGSLAGVGLLQAVQEQG